MGAFVGANGRSPAKNFGVRRRVARPECIEGPLSEAVPRHRTQKEGEARLAPTLSPFVFSACAIEIALLR